MNFPRVNQLVWVSYGDPTIIYTSLGDPQVGLPDSEFNKIVLEAKKQIASRANVLERFDHWEVTGDNPRSLLLSRCKNQAERELVNNYIKNWNTPEKQMESRHDNAIG